MPRIYSGRAQDQAFTGIGQRLVRRSNALEDDYTGDVHPEVRRIVNEMYLRTPDAFSALKWMSGPDGYGVSGPNRINRVREIVPGSGDATQGTASDQPELSRPDDRMNLATHSRFPGTLGAQAPTGWGQAGSGPGEVVVSDDPSDDHQAWAMPVAESHTRMLTKTIPARDGQKLLVAYRVETNGWASGGTSGVAVATGGTLTSSRPLSETPAGDWLWGAVDATSTGVLIAIGLTDTATTDAVTRISRPCVLYMPPDWLSWDEATRQQWLTDHYAASGPDHREFPGYRGMRTIHFSESGMSMQTPALDFSNLTEVTMAAVITRRARSTSATFGGMVQVGDSRNALVMGRDPNRLLWYWRNAASTDHQLIHTTEIPTNKRTFVAGTAKAGEALRAYVDDTEATGVTIAGDLTPPSGMQIDLIRPGSISPFVDMAWAFVFSKALSAAEVATLNSILKGES